MSKISPASEVLPFVAPLEAAFESFHAELRELTDADFHLWPEADAYSGAWTVFPLLGVDDHADLGERMRANRMRCPRSWDVLRALPGLLRAGFSRLAPGTHIYRHADSVGSTQYRCHLGLIVPEGPLLRIHRAEGGGHDDYRWVAGECLVFWGGHEHEAANLGSSPRTVLLCDFDIDAARAGRVE